MKQFITLSFASIFSVNPKSHSFHHYSNFRWHKLLILSFIIFMFFDGANAITFFYGASEPSNDDALNESTIEPPDNTDTKLTNEELYSVFNFCKLLPRLETLGKVRKNKVTREICKRLVTILHPMFRRTDDKPL